MHVLERGQPLNEKKQGYSPLEWERMVWYNVNDIMRKTENTEPKCKLLTPFNRKTEDVHYLFRNALYDDMDPKKDYVNTRSFQ